MKKTLILLLFLFVSYPTYSQLPNWRGEEPVSIRNTGGALTDQQVLVRVNTQYLIGLGLMQANGNDIRFGNNCGGSSLYDYFIEGYMNTDSTKLWVKIPTIPANDSVRIYMFFGNGSAPAVSTLSIFSGPHSSTDSVVVASTNTVSNCQRGFRFTPTQDLLITHFGKRIPNATQRYVTLFDFNTQQIIMQSQVAAGTSGQYNYDPLATPIWLANGRMALLELFNATGDMYYYGASSQIGQHMTYQDMRYCNSCTQNTFPTSVLTNIHYGTPDFLYYVKNPATPEPSYIVYSPADTNTPAAPQNLTGVPGFQQVTLRWNRNSEFDMRKYFVYRNTTNNPGTALLVDSTNHPDTFYTNTGLTNGQTYYFWVRASDRFCVPRTGAYSNVVTVTPNQVVSNGNEIPKVYSLYQNYPNPFNPTTSIRFDIPKVSFVRITVFDVLGREVAVLVNEVMAAGKYSAEWDASSVSSGMYYVKIEANDFTAVKKMTLIK